MHAKERTATSEYDTLAITEVPSPADIAKYRTLRLLALSTDPTCFGSTYTREAVFGNDEWIERLYSGPGKKATFVAARRDSGEWVGMVTAATPGEIPAFVEVPTERAKTYPAVGMWVHPEHRRKGLGHVLVDEAIRWAEQRAKEEDVEGAMFVLEVNCRNEPGRGLYRKAGLEELVEGEENSTVWMKRDLLD